ncbi:formimidoylglutamase [Metabacillus sp. GX 13764]|uniref:formimidoylglutamase n=1 Tax=Metabacillus kandeliae TaxID=2900151 RepID=UPI001E4DCE9A|nr:formimidoylglutamase [Metabacillus kandeliae]MCD7033618.1 formimidoylglutamase [Metabacillus kandeliae]
MEHFRYLRPGKPAVFKDQYVTKVTETISAYVPGSRGQTAIIGLPFSKSSISLSQAAEAPARIRAALGAYSTYSGERNTDYKDHSIIDFGDVLTHPADSDESLNRLYISVKQMLEVKACEKYILLGGDHGVSFPSIKAFHEQFGSIGVIQFDAHHDVRNLEDGGRTNGTPFRSLMESHHLKGSHLVQIGIRDFSNAFHYHEYTKEQGIKVYSMADVEHDGIVAIIENECRRLSKETDAVYLSLDMDAVDQAYAPGCPAIGPGGLTSRELLAAISAAANFKKVIAMDIVEIDPSKDFRDMTSRLAAHAMMRFMYH